MLSSSQLEVIREIGRWERALGCLRVPRLMVAEWREQARRAARMTRWERN